MIEIIDLRKEFHIKSSVLKVTQGTVKAVNGLNLKINKGNTMGLVGESGSGKSTTGRLILRLLEPTSGKILFEGKDISKINNREFRKLRKDLQIVFQNPYSALDGKMTIEDILIQPLQLHKIVHPIEYKKEVHRLLDMVGLSKKDANKFPHEFSGGQRQRIGIARALSTKPKFVVMDEPVSALDVSVQSQILNLVKDLQRELNLSYLFIAHDLSVIRHVSDEVAVMYLGKIVEQGKADRIFDSPKHPYTQALMSASPIPELGITNKRIRLKGEIPGGFKIPSGCSFHDRCDFKMDVCEKLVPGIMEMSDGRKISCHLYSGEV